MERDDLSMIADGLDRMLIGAPLEAIDDARGTGSLADALWSKLTEAGYPKLCAAEEYGGFGGSFADAAVLAQLIAGHAAALPLIDTILVVGMLSACGVEAPELRMGLADPLDKAAPVPHAEQLDAVLRWNAGCLQLVRLDASSITPQAKSEDGSGFTISDGDDVLIEAATPEWLNAQTCHAIAALARAANMAGAMQAVLTLTLNYTQEREQFGRPLAKFQAIQHHLSDIACETAASIAAVEMASDALAADPMCGACIIDEIGIAKIRCGEAAARVAASAHQAHGAMGFTREYALGRYTRRLWQWQDEFGSETWWAMKLGHGVLTDQPCALWPRISQPI